MQVVKNALIRHEMGKKRFGVPKLFEMVVDIATVAVVDTAIG
jgi:hypothetical protein